VRPLDVLIGAVFAAAVALVAFRARALTRSGAIAAFIVGTLTYGAGTVGFTIVLLAFFVSSVALSRFGRARKRALTDVGKAGARDAMQVIANGGVATVCAVGFGLTHDARWAIAFAGAYAAATADTWATELGTLYGRSPRSIVSFKPIATGMSGGVTLIGTGAEIAGALWIGVFAPLGVAVVAPLAIAVVPLAGIAGATADSLLGATLQELRRCDACGRTCETDPHACGNPTRLVRGLRGVSNDVVNLAATAVGAAVAAGLAAVLR
jgi:uncharacterized protein (TIGR00297 family)